MIAKANGVFADSVLALSSPSSPNVKAKSMGMRISHITQYI